MFQKKKPAYASVLKDYQPVGNRNKSAKPMGSPPPPTPKKYSGNDLMSDLKAKIPMSYDYLDKKGLTGSPKKYVFGRLKI